MYCVQTERGFCDCGQCKCTENWSGPSCSCSRDLKGCTKNGVRLTLSSLDYLLTLKVFVASTLHFAGAFIVNNKEKYEGTRSIGATLLGWNASLSQVTPGYF